MNQSWTNVNQVQWNLLLEILERDWIRMMKNAALQVAVFETR